MLKYPKLTKAEIAGRENIFYPGADKHERTAIGILSPKNEYPHGTVESATR
jgi:hypothetical protein